MQYSSLRFIWILGVLLLTACASQTPYMLGDGLPSSGVELVDRRPSEEIRGGLPLFADPTYTVPDTRFEPRLLTTLSARLSEEFGSELEGREIVVTRFRVQNYFGASYARAQSSSLAATAAGAGNIGLASYFSTARSGGAIDVVLVEIAGTIDGVAFDGAGAQPYSANPGAMYMGMVYDLPEAREATSVAVSQALDAVVESVGKASGL